MAYPHGDFDGCSAEPYTGSVCRQQLLVWQECTVGGAEDVILDMTFMEQSQDERERDVAQFFHFLRKLIDSKWLMKLL